MRACIGFAVVVGVAVCGVGPARADGEDGVAAARGDAFVVAGGLAVARPAALPTGLSLGAGAGIAREIDFWAVGARASWSTATEYTLTDTVTHEDIRLRATAALIRPAGRGTLSLRL